MWDLISIAQYGTPHKVAELIAANPAYSDVLIFEAGIDLVIPTVTVNETVTTLPPWKR